MVITSLPSTSNSPPTATVIPIPKPRRLLSPDAATSGGIKAPVPPPRKSLLKSKSVENECNEEVRLRKNSQLIRRDTYQPIFIEREKLQRILEVAEPELKSPKIRPCSFPSSSSTCHLNNSKLELDFCKDAKSESCPLDDFTMSARAIARNRGATTTNTNYSSTSGISNERPLSAYEESEEATRQRKNRRASVAVMPIMELDYRDRIVAGSARSSTMTRRKSEGTTGREFSPDFGAIRVQVEDITSVPGSMMKEDEDEKQPNGRSFDAETSTETITDSALNTNLMSNGVQRVSDWAVPVEYASSPIAQELSQSEVEERPRPPIPTMYMNTSISSATTDRGEESVYSDFVLKRNSSTSSMNGKSVSLLEQIIRTHAVWYLPHMGRPEVLHLLRRMEPGNFIVRASTRENCMALSVRLAPGAHVEIDHYIIEKLIVPLKSTAPMSPKESMTAQTTAKAVRLEGSPLTFRSLPLLIEHYCVNEDELEHRLQLPSAIRACTTTKQLLSIAVMEQEFWAHETSLSRKKTSSTSSSRNSIASSFRSNNNTSNNNNTMPRCHAVEASDTSTWFMDRPNTEDESIYDEVEPRMSSKTGVGGGYYAVHDPKSTLNNNQPRRSSAMLLTPEMALGTSEQQKTSKKRRSTSRASSNSNSRFATVCVGDFASLDGWNSGASKNDTDETDSGLSTHSPPSKHDRLEDVHISRSDRRSQSVRSHKSVTSSPKLGIPSSTSSTLSRPRSFLRSLLSFGSSNKEHKRKESLDIDSTPRLANCEYFTPWDTNGSNMQVRTSRSAFDITSPPARGFFGSTTKKRNGVMPSSSSVYQKNASSSSNMFDDDNYTRGWKEAAYAEMTASPHHNNNHLADPSMRTFKPPNYDEIAGLSNGSPSSRSRPLAMRRERSDLGIMSNGFNLGIKSNAQRLAHHNESSPGPANSNLRVPMTPPANAGDPQVQQNCVEELRRKRLQSANEMLSPHEINAAKHPYGEAHSAHASPQIAMRRRNGFPSPSTSHNGFSRNAFAAMDRNRVGDHRLSVPNLIAATDPLIPGSVGQSAKALRERLGGRTTDGELMVINEGLVTPVVRRKTFAPAMKTTTTSMDELGGEVTKKREALEAALNEKRRHPSDSLSSASSDHSSLGRKTTSTSSSQVPPTTSESELVWRRAKHNAPPPTSSKSSSGGAPQQWKAVNHELKNRQQKIAKVLPTPQPRGHHNRNMSIVGSVGPSMAECRRSSDYAQLCDFASSTEKNGVHLDVHSKIEDDAVSVAGTVFNEPWDSNVWENLLDLAHHGDESTAGLKVSEPIQEEDSDSDRTAGGDSTCQMDSDEDDDDEEDEEIRWQTEKMMRRPLPSDRVTVKGWEQDSESGSSKFNTLDSRSKNGSIAGSTLRRQPEGSFSIRSLPRALSRFSHTLGMNGMSAAASFGSIDDLPTTLPSMSPLLSGRVSRAQIPRSSSTDDMIGRAVQEYVEELAQFKEGDNACFGLTLRQFIACTKDTKETDPAVVIRNVRQFINGMKNYLVKHGEGDLHRIIDEESSRLNSNQILNIDAVLEAVLHKLLLREVKPLLYHVMIKEHSKAGALQLISQNQGVVRKMNLTELGFTNPESLVTPSTTIMEQVKLLMRKMQNHYSPMKKLENLMKAVGLVLGSQSNNGNENENPTDPMNYGHRGLPPGDDLVRWFVYILARTSTVGCEVEAWYMWELLPQPIVTQSDASYYLTSLWSAVHILKSTEAIRRLCENDHRVMMSVDSSRKCCSSPLLSTATLTRGTSNGLVQMISGATCDAFVKIAIPDEAVGCVRWATFPGVPMLTTSKLTRLVAHQQGITNPEEHGLYLIAEGFESCLAPTDCPVLVHEQLKKENKPHMFAYKRHEAKIAWSRAAIC